MQYLIHFVKTLEIVDQGAYYIMNYFNGLFYSEVFEVLLSNRV